MLGHPLTRPLMLDQHLLGHAKVMLGLGGGSRKNLPVTLFKTVLEFTVADHQHVLLVP